MATDEADHRAACHRWESVAAEPDVTMLFSDVFADGQAVRAEASDAPVEAKVSDWAPTSEDES